MSADAPRRPLTVIVVVAVLLATIAIAVTRAVPAQAETRVEHGVVWRRVDGVTLRADAFVPPGPGGAARPAVLLLHGGGWAGGDRAEIRDAGEALAAAGYVAVTVDYRLAPEHPYPAALEDARAAVEWLREPAQVAHYGIDPARVGALGSSAGGQLVGLLATTGVGPVDTGSRVRAAASWSGPMLFWSLDELDDGPLPPATVAWWADSVTTYLGCADLDAACAERAHDASPLNHVDSVDTPMLLANGGDEIVPVSEATTMHRVLDAAGVANRLLVVPGRGHASDLHDAVWADTLAFLDEHLRGTAAPR